MRSGLLVMLLVGCNGGQGVDVEIHGAKPLTSAELWLAYDYCHIDETTKCDGIVWPGAQNRVSGTVFTLGDDEKVFRTDLVSDGVAQLHLDAIPDANKPIAIGIVGYAGTEVVGARLLEGVEIPLHDQAHWRVELEDASPKPTEAPTADPTMASPQAPDMNALVWDRLKSSRLADPTGYAGCLALQKWTGAMWETFYFVPSSDPDCDGDPPDCNPYWYNAPVGSAKCVTQQSSSVPPNVCAVGVQSCRAEMGDVNCAEQIAPMTCVGSAVCTACAGSPDLATCLKSQIVTTSSAPAVPLQRCQMLETDQGPCNSRTTTPAAYDTQFFIRGGACAPAVANTEIAVIRQVLTPFSGGGASGSTPSGAGLVVHATPNAGQGCTVVLSYVTGTPMPGISAVLVAVSYGPSHEILIPVLVDIQKPSGGTLCPTATGTVQSCTQLGSWPEATAPGDSMFDCTVGP